MIIFDQGQFSQVVQYELPVQGQSEMPFNEDLHIFFRYVCTTTTRSIIFTLSKRRKLLHASKDRCNESWIKILFWYFKGGNSTYARVNIAPLQTKMQQNVLRIIICSSLSSANSFNLPIRPFGDYPLLEESLCLP